MQIRKYSFFLGFVLVLGIAGGIYYFARPHAKNVAVVGPNLNVNSALDQPNCKDLDEPWTQSEFKNGIYKNAAFGFKATIPNGWYLQREDHTQKECSPPSPTFGSTSTATFGDSGENWSIVISSLSNPDNLNLSQWAQKNYVSDGTMFTKTFGSVRALYGLHTPIYVSEDDYMHVAILQTGKWIQIIMYRDKDSGMPRQAKFEKLLASVKPFVGTQAATQELRSAIRKSMDTSTDLYTDSNMGFSIEVPHIWYARTAKDSVLDRQYLDFATTFESSPKPLFLSDGPAPQYPDAVSLSGSSMYIERQQYFNSKFSDYLDSTFHKGAYTSKSVDVGNSIHATRVSVTSYVTPYSPIYVLVSGDYVYTIGVRAANSEDEKIITTILKSFKLL